MAVTNSVHRFAAGFVALGASAAQSSAQEYCVSCTQPVGVYRCVIEGAQPGGSQPLQMLCITAMAKEGGHGTCAVKGGTVFDCKGPVKRVSWAAYNQRAPEKAAAPPPTDQTPAVAPPDPAQPPQTVEEMAKRANQKTAEKLRKANEDWKGNVQSFGEKMSNTTKKTWRCLSSFLTRCTE